MPSHMRDIQFHYTSLFSQELHSLEPILADTSCMNPEDAELIGLVAIAQKRAKDRKQEARAERLKQKGEELQILGMSKWVKGELTHLGLRLGHRNKQDIDLSSDIDLDDEHATTTS